MTPDRFRTLVSTVLAVGVGISAMLVAAGFLSSFVVGWQGSLTGAPVANGDPTDFGGVVAGVLAARPVAIAQLGLLVLLATPVIRVATSVVAFATERDRLYTAVTLGVLSILLFSLFGAH